MSKSELRWALIVIVAYSAALAVAYFAGWGAQ